MAASSSSSTPQFASIIGDSVTCKLCASSVKSMKVWTAHINGKIHRQKLIDLKQKQPTPSSQKVVKRSHAQINGDTGSKSSDPESKKIKKIPKDFFDTAAIPNPVQVQVSVKPKENGTLQSGEIASTSTLLPEGFFDNKKLDAKARNVDVKDSMDDEWQKFQKEISHQQKVADILIDDEDNRLHTDREIIEVEDEISDLAKFVDLERKETEIKSALRIKPEPMDFDDNGESDDEEDNILLDDYLNDWRAKKF